MIKPSVPPEEPARSKLTSSGEIKQLEELLSQKKKAKEDMDLKYRPIVQIVVDAIAKDNLNYELVLELLTAHYKQAE